MSRHTDLPRTTDVEAPHTYLLIALAWLARLVVRRRYRITVTGLENFPRSGPVLVAGNHMGFLDGPLMAIFAPRPLHALTKREMFTGKTGILLTQSGQIPVWRRRADPDAIEVALRVLRDGGAVGIFPEGTRGAGEMKRAEGGTAYLAMATGAPVIPMVFLGTRETGGSLNSVPAKGARMHLHYGKPIHLDERPWPRRRDDVRRETEQIRLALADLLLEAVAETQMTLPGPVPATDQKEKL